uniref:Uncharacterized protein n=1 Tax=Moniliophthora roreri TaxID=221103 RepID=A0A0W0EU72_MONRR
MSIPGNFDSTNQQQSQFVPSGWVPSTEHPNPPAVSWTDLYSIYQTVSQLGATLGTMQQTQGATLQSLNAITAHLTQLQVLDEGPKGVPKFKEPNVFNSKASLVTQFLQDIRNAIQLSHRIDDRLHERELEKKKDRKPKDTRVDSPEPDPIPPSTSTTTPSLPTGSTLPLGTPMEIDAMKSKHHS